MTILVIITVIFLVLLAGMLLAFLFTRADRAVTTMRADMAAEERAYNPGVTLGHKIKVESDYEEQLRQARQLAAKEAAELPRGANNRIGRAGQSTLATAGQSAKSDPMTAVRVARFHGWDGARTGAPSVGTVAAPAPGVAAAPGAAVAVAPAAGIAPPVLITITPDMPPEEVRKARVANAKAEAAYNKALKAAASGAPVAPPAGAVAAAPAAAVAAAPAAAHIAPPKLIEITESMAPEEVRKARIANAKAEAAYNKALKAAGASAGAGEAIQPAAAVAAVQPVPAGPTAAAPVVGITPPKLIEITPDMAPEEVRKARVANAKAESAYNKALKSAGIDPASVKAGAAVPAAAAAPIMTPDIPAGPTVQEAQATAAASPAKPDGFPAAGIAPPQLIEITEGMSPEDVRRARVANAKATAAYNKALKAAGIDPASVK